MKGLSEAVEEWSVRAGRRIEGAQLGASVDFVGRVEEVGDGTARVRGLPEVRLDELLVFADGTIGMAIHLEPDRIGCILVGSDSTITAGDEVRATGEVARVPVGEGLLGRMVDALGRPVDGGEAVEADAYQPVERPAPGVVDRELITEPLATGLLTVDAMIPVGRGQRELIIGDRNTGKTAIAVDTVINQRNTDVICVYAFIGQKASAVKSVVEAVREHGDTSRVVFVVGEADDPPAAQWLVPYAACTIAEFFRDRGDDALIVFDDLSKHAAVYRELSLLLGQPPGREAYPGDIFYIHSRLLERAANVTEQRGGGSLTALPIAETQEGNLSGYIPTNLVSMTDGQIYLEPELFNQGQKPAIDVGKSVSRVGGKTQSAVMNQLAANLRLEYTQFRELEGYTRFGVEIDERTRRRIEHGRRIRALLSQPQYQPRPVGVQIALLLGLDEGVFDEVAVAAIPEVEEEVHRRLDDQFEEVTGRIEQSDTLEERDRRRLLELLEEVVAGVEDRE